MLRFVGWSVGRRGLALPSAMFALVAVSILVVGLFVMADLSAGAIRNRERAARAMQLAEAGVAHTVAVSRRELRRLRVTHLLRGGDTLQGTSDDSLLTNSPLVPTGDWIPLGGRNVSGGSYFVTLLDDPDDPIPNPMIDGNERILARCRGVTTDGAVAEVEAIIAATPMPGIATEGNLNVSGNPQVLGACGSVHANGNLNVNVGAIVAEQISAVGTITGGAVLPDGTPAPEYPGAPPVDIPDLNPMDYCTNADYILQSNGFVLVVATGQLINASSSPWNGWKRSGGPPQVKWDLSGDQSIDGTYCVQGNVNVSGNTGSAADPRNMSLIASGDIEISGNPYLTSDDPDNIQFMAGGDLKMNGNPEVGVDNFSGLMYAGSQCDISGNPNLGGQIMCDNKGPPAGSLNLVSQNSISGNPTVTFNCGGNIFNRRRVLIWYQRFNAS